MEKIRIEIHLEKKEVKIIDKIAVDQGRSRKNLCETEIRKIIKKEQLTQGLGCQVWHS